MVSVSGKTTPLPSFSSNAGVGGISEVSLHSALNSLTKLNESKLNQFNNLFSFIPIKLNKFPLRIIKLPILTILLPKKLQLSFRKDGRLNHQSNLSHSNISHSFTRKRILLSFLGTISFLFFILYLLISLIRPFIHLKAKLPFTGDPDTLIFNQLELSKIWQWEIASGRYPSRRKPDFDLYSVGSTDLTAETQEPSVKYYNPGVPKFNYQAAESLGKAGESVQAVTADLPHSTLVAIGPPRQTLSIKPRPIYSSSSLLPAPSPYPPRPIQNSIIDLDTVMDYCDFSTGKYVRDCLEILRMNAGLDTGLRRGNTDHWRMNYLLEKKAGERVTNPLSLGGNVEEILNYTNFETLLEARTQLTLLPPSFRPPHPTYPNADAACNPDLPKIFHIFWAGPFTDKPYSAALSFLYTQKLGLDKPLQQELEGVCRPQLWIWINPGPASSLPNPNARREMISDLKANPWSSPFLHSRFKEVVQFKLWNTTEQLNGIEEMKGWQEMRLFNSGGVKYGAEAEKKPTPVIKKEITLDEDGLPPAAEVTDESDTSEDMIAEAELSRFTNTTTITPSISSDNSTNSTIPTIKKSKDVLFERLGSSSSSEYDRLSVVLSDMARFVLTHHYGGIYLDADTILLRDWEELFNYNGAFAYRWSRMKKYNTAVLKMSRGSALGNFIFRSAVANGLDFHPMTVSRYTLDAKLEGLLLRLPDALFDPAWLNTEYYQRDRPPVPYFKRFEDFFETPKEISALPLSLGIHGFFKGAFSYHFHNFWWIPFDQKRNYPDLGKRFEAGERIARGRLHAAHLASLPNVQNPTSTKLNYQWGDNEADFDSLDWSNEKVEQDGEDLSWSTVLKRTFESFLRGESGNLYGEWIHYE